jgi:hypothetical protein
MRKSKVPNKNIRSARVNRESRTKLVFVWTALMVSSVMLQNIEASETAYWDTVYYPCETKLDVSVYSPVPLSNVYCEIILVDDKDTVVDKQQLQITHGETESLPKDRRTTKTLTFDAKGASISAKSLLFAEPVLSSPKAMVPGSVAGLRNGITASGHRRR